MQPQPTSRQRHLKTLFDEQQRSYDSLTAKIQAVDTDLRRTIDSEQRLSLEGRKNQLLAEREQVLAHMEQIEHQLTQLAELSPSAAQAARPEPATQTIPPPAALAESGVPASGDLLTIAEPVRIEMIHVPEGVFLMGTRAADIDSLVEAYGGNGERYKVETERYPLRLPEFYIARTEVTVEQFAGFVQATGHQTTAEQRGWGLVKIDEQWVQTPGASWRNPRGPGSDTADRPRHPVTQVSWFDTQLFCKWLDEALDPAIRTLMHEKGWVLRLPTEAEWEKAASGPNGLVFPWGNQEPSPALCNYGMRLKDTTRVDQYPAGQSPYGILDMSGNVWEWTASLWGSKESDPPLPYPYDPNDGREDPNAIGPRVMRGGSYHDAPWIIRCAFRHRHPQRNSIDCGGFRLVLGPPMQPANSAPTKITSVEAPVLPFSAARASSQRPVFDPYADLKRDLANGEVCAFVGAGLSVGAGLPGWYDLISGLAAKIGYELPEAHWANGDMLIDAAQAYVNDAGLNSLVRYLKDQLGTIGKSPAPAHQALARLPISLVFTANFDNLLERAFRDAGRPTEVVVRDSTIPFMRHDPGSVNIVKLYGDLDQPDTIVLAREQYERYFLERPQLVKLLETELARSTMLYLGWSHSDPHFNLVFGEMLGRFQQYLRTGYAVMFDPPNAKRKEMERKHVRVVQLPAAGDRTAQLAAWLQDLAVGPVP